MNALTKLIVLEAKLFLRDPVAWLSTLVLPTGILLVLGTIPGLRTPNEAFGGQRFIDLFAPSLVVITLAMLGVNILPIRLATYREKGVLRRLGATPINPAALLLAQLIVHLVVAVCAVALLLLVGRLGFAIALPQHMLGFVAAFLLGTAALFALGLLIAALAATARTGTALATPLFLLTMLLGGVYVPRFFLPPFVQQLGAYTPPGVQGLQDAWLGVAPQPLQLLGMAIIAVAAGAAAARLFRWE
jgi:ABC-2 type transport system permease protein